MGLTLHGNKVLVDHSHNRLLNTSIEGNPTVCKIAGLTVFSIFKREKASRQIKQHGGDNCHLLYALKGKDQLETTRGSIKSLLPAFNQILQKIPQDYDLVVPMPSKYWISTIVAKRLARRSRIKVTTDIFQKITIDQARETLENLDLPSQEKRKIDFRLKNQGNSGGSFSLKEIPTKYRQFFCPLILCNRPQANLKKVLLVDDLLSTGTTLNSAKTLLQPICIDTEIDAVCLFSQV